MVLLTLFNRLRWQRMEIVLVLWPPAHRIFDEVEAAIGAVYPIIQSRNVVIRDDAFDDFIIQLYAIDFSGENKIRPKMARLKELSHGIRVLKINIPTPTMVAQDLLNHVRCREVNALKDGLRAQFRGRIDNYIYDVLLHSTEVEYQNRPLLELIEASRAD